ncbi:expressed unknown protein [Seminavis robusta]|uniref:Uncharacterized protein n=1 Tax=Seminavis robusta TaxID=568900 RepID=A0A9N8HLB3_9STRA|nr:expressed unknown protein [Seminavis robusta]|eukprot:Sro670_g184750.1 n/a (288) ;mRNA; r:49231-50094
MEATVVASENVLKEHGSTINPTAAFVLSSLGTAIILFSLLSTCIRYRNHDEDECVVPKNGLRALMIALTSLLVSMLLYFIYAIMLMDRDKMDYLGPMRVTGVRYQERISSTIRGGRKHYKTYYDAVYDLNWGYEWACPGMMSPDGRPGQCQSSVDVVGCSVRICQRRVCFDTEKYEALNQVEACVQHKQVFDLNATYTAYNPYMGPSQDVDWPHINAFGNCETCESKFSVATSDALADIQIAASVFLGAGCLLLIVLTYLWCRPVNSNRDVHPEPPQEKEPPPSKQL